MFPIIVSTPKDAIVAAIQFAPVLLDVDKNLAVGLQLAFEAAAKGARVIVLPELCTSGYVLGNCREAADCSQQKDGYQSQAFLDIAQRFNCHIVFGYVETCEGRLYNSAAVVGPRGLAGNFQKHNRYGTDNLWAEPSEQVPVTVVTGAGRLGALICRDGANRYRESYQFYNSDHRFYKKGSVDTIALLTNWGDKYAYPDSSWVELVEETDANVIVSNRVGKERDMKWKGGACVIDRNLSVQTFGSSFVNEAVVGGRVIL